MTQRVAVQAGMRVSLRKPHPCGGNEWVVTRAGADVGLECLQCRRRVLLEREEFERRFKQALALPEGPPHAEEAGK
ncbi:MAG TPA: DUF951 domain-containing protein [Chthonomonadaceae bacterium]|nr:DUF951 domain-containing protein [Chthonomonadaceae bacterium]